VTIYSLIFEHIRFEDGKTYISYLPALVGPVVKNCVLGLENRCSRPRAQFSVSGPLDQ